MQFGVGDVNLFLTWTILYGNLAAGFEAFSWGGGLLKCENVTRNLGTQTRNFSGVGGLVWKFGRNIFVISQDNSRYVNLASSRPVVLEVGIAHRFRQEMLIGRIACWIHGKQSYLFHLSVIS